PSSISSTPCGRGSSATGVSGGMFVRCRWRSPNCKAVDEANNIVNFRRSPIIRVGNDQPLRRGLWTGAGGVGALLAGQAFGAAESARGAAESDGEYRRGATGSGE